VAAQFLNAQTAPFQVLVRAEPVDLDSHVRRARSRAESLAEPLASVARDYATFIETLARHPNHRAQQVGTWCTERDLRVPPLGEDPGPQMLRRSQRGLETRIREQRAAQSR